MTSDDRLHVHAQHASREVARTHYAARHTPTARAAADYIEALADFNRTRVMLGQPLINPDARVINRFDS
jgi:hypothetical protein